VRLVQKISSPPSMSADLPYTLSGLVSRMPAILRLAYLLVLPADTYGVHVGCAIPISAGSALGS